MSEWRPTKLRSLIDAGVVSIQTGPFGSQLHKSDYTEVGIPVIPTEAIAGRRLDTTVCPRVTPETVARLARHKVRSGDILFARRGIQATGLSALVRPEEEGWLCGTGAILLRVLEVGLDSTFLSFFLSANESIDWLKAHAVGAVMPNLNTDVISGLPILLPPLPEQRAIARILGALDDKIELNRHTNETLEAMARALFKSWFVDFDPVRAKMEGRAPAGMDATTAALFPDRFDRDIPSGWSARPLGELVSVLETGSRPTGGARGIDSGIPSLGAESVTKAGEYDFTKTKLVPAPYFQAMKRGHLKDWDVLLYKDGGRPGEFEPHVSLVGLGFPFKTMAINEHVYRIRATNDCQAWLYFSLSSESVLEEMRTKGTGVAIPGLNSSAARSIAILSPAPTLVKRADDMLLPCVTGILSNALQSRTLAALRDALLPRLLSGELRVRDAERLAERAL